MNKVDRFVHLAQMYLIIVRQHDALQVLDEAMRLEEHVIPDDVLDASTTWLKWKTAGAEKPQWLVEYEENVRNVVQVLKLDGNDEWWINAEKLIDGANVPKIWIKFVTERDPYVEMTRTNAEGFLEWAKEVRGWSDDDPPLRLVSPS